jgi:hypothetical protein
VVTVLLAAGGVLLAAVLGVLLFGQAVRTADRRDTRARRDPDFDLDLDVARLAAAVRAAGNRP